ncbi:glycosyltransferase [Pseudomonas sp. CAN2814]|uniref:glycosyltransferase n=1 Tax=Pseudomonas sp. CAN1 TaxID=3046726 RepID=UPI002649472E|nr:glycosyltransferase [Pseudomonas sp. CAN1]MDN6857391.1 glycosyltransferase [Pseudomonas sp. CAN1]
MSVKRYGLYIAYAPTVDLRREGLGRYLASFLKGAQQRDDAHFVVACPSWSRQSLADLFDSEGLLGERVTILSPDGEPYLLRLYERYQAYQQRRRTRVGLRQRLRLALHARLKRGRERIERHLAQAHSPRSLLALLGDLGGILLLALLAAPFALVAVLLGTVWRLLRPLTNRLVRAPLHQLRARLSGLLSDPKGDDWVVRVFRAMHQSESQRMKALIEGRDDVAAWYCPTAFWPEFNEIDVPRLMCVPDVVLNEFSIGFAEIGGDRFLDTFETVGRAIRSADHLVAYSQTIKWQTLVERYAVAAERVNVVPHAANRLDHLVEVVSGFDDPEATSLNYCRSLLLGALEKSSNPAYARGVRNRELKFLFYASQFRPNKNLLSLLKAYEFLLRRRFIPHKLLLTGDPQKMPEIEQYIRARNLEQDVICVPGLSLAELAACYKLADLAVNPSLSEGGCPFTFTEALSVGTPVVMANIPVTLEVLRGEELQQASLFDPYDWQDMAERIHWALNHHDELLALQLPAYEALCQRDWSDVAGEHIAILERISRDAVPS